MSNPSQQPAITVNDSTPQVGDTISVSYSGPKPVTLDLNWDPAGSPTTITIPANGIAKLKIPAGASSLIITDPTPNGADAVPLVIQP